MKIGIDVTGSIYAGTGVASYYRSLIPQVLKLGGEHKFVLLGYALRQFGKLDLANRKVPIPPRVMEFLWNQVHLVPVEVFTGAVDVFHAWDYLQPPARRAKIVTTVHDLTAIKFPMYHHRLTVNAQERRLRWVRREASAVIADSVATKNDIIELLGMGEKKIHVVSLAAGESYGAFWRKGEKFVERQILRLKKEYGIEGSYILSVGTIEPRKNVKRIIEAFSILRDRKEKIGSLVVAGRIGWGDNLEKSQGVIPVGKIDSSDLPALYAGARALVYPSLYEGFGLPVLEAMSVGCPVVTSARGSLEEVAGRAAVLVEPEEAESIADGILTAINTREVLVKKGLKQAAKFSWQRAAQETLKVYESLDCRPD